MCQIATIGNIKNNSQENKHRLEKVIKLMLVGMSETNKDGSGMAFSNTSGQVFMTKSKKTGAQFAAEFSLDEDLDYKHIIMHTRTATHGAVSDQNAHPHESHFGYLVQNGWNSELYEKYKSEMKTGCDTEALAHVYNPDINLFNEKLLGSEHFAIAHLDSDGNTVRVVNKNKMLYTCFSEKLSANIFCTSSSVIKDVGKLIGEELDYRMVHDGEHYILNGESVEKASFKFKDTGYSWPYPSNWSNWDFSDTQNKYNSHEPVVRRVMKPVSYKPWRKNDDSIPDHVFRMTRRERKRWIRDNKEKRDEYVKFWTEHERELKMQEAQEEELRDEGFTILDSDGNVIE